MTKLIIIRHGQSMANLKDIFAGDLDIELSPLGEKQVKQTAQYVVEKYKIDKIYSSDLKRAYGTAKPISELSGIEIIPDKNLREISAGEWEGLNFTYLAEKYKEDYGVWKNDIGNARCTGGESARELAERIQSELIKIAEENVGKTIVITTHATPIRTMQCLWQGMTLDSMKDVHWVSNASVTEADYEDGKFTLIKAGEDAHLGDMSSKLPANV